MASKSLLQVLRPAQVITIHPIRCPRTRHISTTPIGRQAPAAAKVIAPELEPEYEHQQQVSAQQSSPRPRIAPLTNTQREFLSRALRVNQAGELAATLIYTAQTSPIVQRHPHLAPLMKHMYDQEAGHFSTFNALIHKHRIRPTALYPVWSLAATTLGWVTGVMGREAAMACTEAVETEIGQHYNDQVRELFKWITEARERGEEIDEELGTLVGELKRIRDEELEHLDHAVDEGAKMARPYEVLTGVIRGGCRGAIWLSERV